MRKLFAPLTLVVSTAYFACGGASRSGPPDRLQRLAPSSASGSSASASPISAASASASDDEAGGHGGFAYTGEDTGVAAEGSGLGSVGSGGNDRFGSGRKVRTIKMTEAGTDIQGRLPPEVIKRIVRANYPRFRACYEAGLKDEPTLHGIVAVDFLIDAQGNVVGAHSVKGSMPSAKVVDCVVRVFASLGFPEPEADSVKVHYPIDFQHEDSL